MTVTNLVPRRVSKVWGRRDLLPIVARAAEDEEPVGEIWFEDPAGRALELLVKYLFTSQKLSIQVHPTREAARALGYRDGKDEAWLIIEAEPGARIALGPKVPLTTAQLAAAAKEGRLEELMSWREVAAGDFFFSPAGTLHALGGGLKLIEIQQNIDLTYRLYDYGRPRELHLEEALAVAERTPYSPPFAPYDVSPGRRILAESSALVVERWRGAHNGVFGEGGQGTLWIVPLAGKALADGTELAPGAAWVVDGSTRLATRDDFEFLVAYGGPGVRERLFSPADQP